VDLRTRFTSYDFKQMKRRSYYPTNQQIISTVSAASGNVGAGSSRPSTPINGIANGGIGTESIRGDDLYADAPPPLPNTKMIPMEKGDAMMMR
jgi:hypothetical protein